MGKVCIVGAERTGHRHARRHVTVEGKTFKEGDDISIDGFTGEVFAGAVATKPSEVVQVLIKKELAPEKSDVYRRFQQVMDWADEHRKLRVRTNADLPDQAAEAIAFGAEGIGLCRTEHMFFDHIAEMREMIMAGHDGSREKALAKLLPFQRDDFAGLFRAMAGRPVTIRLLDPPLHEFLPQDTGRAGGDGQGAAARRSRRSPGASRSLHESNPMLGHRGCRLGIVYPEITAMQARAIFEAACRCRRRAIDGRARGDDPAGRLPARSCSIRRRSSATDGRRRSSPRRASKVEYLVGTMIEVPRAAWRPTRSPRRPSSSASAPTT